MINILLYVRLVPLKYLTYTTHTLTVFTHFKLNSTAIPRIISFCFILFNRWIATQSLSSIFFLLSLKFYSLLNIQLHNFEMDNSWVNFLTVKQINCFLFIRLQKFQLIKFDLLVVFFFYSSGAWKPNNVRSGRFDREGKEDKNLIKTLWHV